MKEEKPIPSIIAVILEDEPLAASALRTLVQECCPLVKIEGIAGHLHEAVELIYRTGPELILVDIQLADCTGFDVLRQARIGDAEVIFTTAFDRFAIQAFEEHAIAYLVKPLDEDALEAALSRAVKILRPERREELISEKPRLNMSMLEDKVWLQDHKGSLLVDAHSIVAILAQGAYSKVHFLHREPCVISKHLRVLEELFAPFGFFRAHRSVLVNTQYIDRIEQTQQLSIHLTTGLKVPLARKKRKELIDRFPAGK